MDQTLKRTHPWDNAAGQHASIPHICLEASLTNQTLNIDGKGKYDGSQERPVVGSEFQPSSSASNEAPRGAIDIAS
ncbi:MAG: hypothetical protein Q9212_005831 [Teloschistes hypoglaucus]